MRHQQNTSSAASTAFLSKALCALIFSSALLTSTAEALELDWSGQFRAEYNFIHNYSLDNTDAANTYDTARGAANGYYVPSGGSADASFETLFLRVRPKLVVNDNIYIKTEWWVGDPVYSIFGNGTPYTGDQRQFYSNQNRGSLISAQRFWLELLTDIGTVQIGRAPLNWGLGLVWNSGDGLWDRYESTGDTIRLLAKFGAFSFVPSFVLYSAGNNVGGACNFTSGSPAICTPAVGSGGVQEYTLALKYENSDEDLEGGLNFIKRLAGAAQDSAPASTGTGALATPPGSGYLGPLGSPASMNYNIWDIYARKRFGKVTLAAEAPITSGNLGTSSGSALDYSTFAFATETNWKISDTWELLAKLGHAPGQPNSSNPGLDNFRAFFFNPAYRLGLIMFNYQLANFAGPNTQNNPSASPQSLKSPYDNPIVNANYLVVSGLLHTDKWTFNANLIYAQADKTCASGQFCYNTRSRSVTSAVSDQSSSLGTELDLGTAFQWDEYFLFRFDAGVWLPGDFYKFSNVAGISNNTSPVYGLSARVGVTF